VSEDGHYSKGIFQLLDSTGKEMVELSGTGDDYDPFDPAMNSYLGVGYLRRLLDMFSEPTALSSRTSTQPAKNADELEKFAVAAFNAGQGSVARAQAQAQTQGRDPSQFSSIEEFLPASTREYVARVQRHKDEFLRDEADKTLA
jgi:soluble lytic murein transglycosylase-like protein